VDDDHDHDVLCVFGSNEQSDMLHRLYRDPNLNEIPTFKLILKQFITNEIIR
jgi:hypothetical protein